jgi:uncharacterized membrane protein
MMFPRLSLADDSAGFSARMERHASSKLQPVVLHRTVADDGLSLRAWLAMWGMTLLSLGLLVWRMRMTGRSGHLSIGTLDLWLAWFPVPVALLIARLAAMRNVRYLHWHNAGIGALAVLWLAFFPNSPYLVTELFHLDSSGDYGPSNRDAPSYVHFLTGDGPFVHHAPPWLDLLFLVAVAAAGVLLTFASLRLIHGVIARRLPPRASSLAVFGLILLGSYGVALGRFDRFNSWTLASHPINVISRVAEHVVNPLDKPEITATTLVMTALLTIGYFSARDLGPPKRA